MTGFLASRPFLRGYGAEVERVESETGLLLERILLPSEPDARVEPAELSRVEIAHFSADMFPDFSPAFFSAANSSPQLRWLHVFNVGTDHAVFQRFIERGILLTNSAGASAAPIAQTLIGGLLMLARGFPRWQRAQSRREWPPFSARDVPVDLADQTLVVVGLGSIGSEIARLGRSLGLHVIGVRRSPQGPDDPVDEFVPASRLHQVLPRADWLALACSLNDETRHLIDAAAIAQLPPGAHVLNIARGEVLEEAALIDALRSGHIAGAYLDVFEVEPLPKGSPLWQLPNVILSPHSAGSARGNGARQAACFLRNLERWARKQPLQNIVSGMPPT